jgi:heat shock protein HtpX
VSTGLLANMTREEVEAVLAHEVAPHRQRRHGDHDADPRRDEHVRGVLEPRNWLRGRRLLAPRGTASPSGPGIGYLVTSIVMEIVLGFLAAIIVGVVQSSA